MRERSPRTVRKRAAALRPICRRAERVAKDWEEEWQAAALRLGVHPSDLEIKDAFAPYTTGDAP